MPKDFLSNDIAHPHHTRAIWTGVAAIVVFGFIIWGYIAATSGSPNANDGLAASSNSNAPVPLNAEEIKLREDLDKRNNDPVPLTREEIEARK